jgi:hypothetical protein
MSGWNRDHAAHRCRGHYLHCQISSYDFPLLGEMTTDEFQIFAEKLMSDALLPFVKANFNMMSARKWCSLCQELHWAAPSSRHIILFSKSEMKGVIE